MQLYFFAIKNVNTKQVFTINGYINIKLRRYKVSSAYYKLYIECYFLKQYLPPGACCCLDSLFKSDDHQDLRTQALIFAVARFVEKHRTIINILVHPGSNGKCCIVAKIPVHGSKKNYTSCRIRHSPFS